MGFTLTVKLTCLVLSGCVKYNTTFPCGNSIFQYKKLKLYHFRTMSTWVHTEKSTKSCLHCIRDRRIKAPGLTLFLTIHHPPTIGYHTLPTNNHCYSQDCTQLGSLLSQLIHNIDMWHAGIVHRNKLKPVLVHLTQHHPVFCASTSYELKYSPFD